jgi:uracil-DNA glycosylase
MEKLLFGLSDIWIKILNNNTISKDTTTDLKTIIDKLSDCKHITPPIDKIFEFARLTEYKNIKVVIIGQDPYPKKGEAHGLAFSCLKGVPGSLRNIYSCLVKNKLIESMPTTGCLTRWASQGILLLNRTLTTETGKSNVHVEIWDEYIIELVKKIDADLKPIFLLWGNEAKKLKKYVTNSMEWFHPSPLVKASGKNFDDCPHFLEINKIYPKISWEVIDNLSLESILQLGSKSQVVFTDGSCYPNKICPEARAGYCACFAWGTMKDIVIYGSVGIEVTHASNQRAEGTAILKVLEYLNENPNWNDVVIITDSDFWIQMFAIYMLKWERDGLKANSGKVDKKIIHGKTDKSTTTVADKSTTTVADKSTTTVADKSTAIFYERKNPDLTISIWQLYKSLTAEKYIRFRHVKSHDKDGWSTYPEDSYEYFCYTNNDFVDKYCNYARKKCKPGENIIKKVQYDK